MKENISFEELMELEHDVRLSNLDIVRIAYLVKDVVSKIVENQIRLSIDANTCYWGSFYVARYMLKAVDREYFDENIHKGLLDFYREGRDLSLSAKRHLSWVYSCCICGKNSDDYKQEFFIVRRYEAAENKSLSIHGPSAGKSNLPGDSYLCPECMAKGFEQYAQEFLNNEKKSLVEEIENE